MDGYPQGPQWTPGSIVGDYEVIEHIASGGMAEVYAAVPRGGGEPVVLKAMSRNLLANEEFVRLFLDEAQLIATLRHPNIGQIFDRGEYRGTHYFVMEYVLGTSCRELLNRAVRDDVGHIPAPHAIDLCCDIATALHYAHERRSPSGKNYGIVHRDVSHSNVLVTFDGVTKLIDFGVAKSSMRSTETKVGSLKGKVRYMSPEQIRGEALDRRSDLFSLGIMLWEMTTGQRLFRAPNEAATLHKILYEDIRPPSDAAPGYPPELERIVLSTLAKRPQDRPDTGEELATELTAFARRAGLVRGGVATYLRKLFGDEIDRARVRFAELRRRSQTQLPLPPRLSASMTAAAPAQLGFGAPSVGLSSRAPQVAPPLAVMGAPTTMAQPQALGSSSGVPFASPPAHSPFGPIPASAAASDPGTRSISETQMGRMGRTGQLGRAGRLGETGKRNKVALLLFAVIVIGVIGGGLLLAGRRPPAPSATAIPGTSRVLPPLARPQPTVDTPTQKNPTR